MARFATRNAFGSHLMRNHPADYPVALPDRPPVRFLRPFAKAVTLVGICVASMLTGGFLLPGSVRTEAEPAAQAEIVGAVQAVASDAPALPGPVQVPVAEAPRSPTPRSPHPLNAAPKVEPRLPDGPAYALAASIDRAVEAALVAAIIPASPIADDAEFLRRVSLDLTGTIPTYERTMSFL